MKAVMLINDLEKMKTISDPLRVQILSILIRRKATVKQVADEIGESSAKLYYHVKALQKQGMIRIVAMEEKGGILEKYYRAVAKGYKIDYNIN